MPQPIGAPGAFSPPAAPSPPPQNALGKDTFMKLLVAQLKYQDPLNPAEGSEFLAQSAQFTMVEKLEEIAARSTEMLQSQHRLSAGGFLGRTIIYGAGAGQTEGTVTGARFGPDGVTLVVGSTEVPITEVVEVRS